MSASCDATSAAATRFPIGRLTTGGAPAAPRPAEPLSPLTRAFRTRRGANELAGSAGPLWAALASPGGVTAAAAVGEDGGGGGGGRAATPVFLPQLQGRGQPQAAGEPRAGRVGEGKPRAAGEPRAGVRAAVILQSLREPPKEGVTASPRSCSHMEQV